jgi:hypothetical protein
MYRRYGGPEVLEYGEPHVGPDSVLVRVAAAGVNPLTRNRVGIIAAWAWAIGIQHRAR